MKWKQKLSAEGAEIKIEAAEARMDALRPLFVSSAFSALSFIDHEFSRHSVIFGAKPFSAELSTFVEFERAFVNNPG